MGVLREVPHLGAITLPGCPYAELHPHPTPTPCLNLLALGLACHIEEIRSKGQSHTLVTSVALQLELVWNWSEVGDMLPFPGGSESQGHVSFGGHRKELSVFLMDKHGKGGSPLAGNGPGF